MTKPDALTHEEWALVQRALTESSMQWSTAYSALQVCLRALSRDNEIELREDLTEEEA